MEKLSDAQTQSALLAAARVLAAENPNFSVKTLLTRTGVSRTGFRRCFSSKMDLLTALAREDVKGLSDILEAAQPAAQTMRAAVGSDIAPAPAADAWLERRLRVFERALNGVEKRQDKSEQNWAIAFALIEEKLDALTARQQAAQQTAPQPQAPAPQPAPVVPEPEPVIENIAGDLADAAESDRLAPSVLAHIEEIADAATEPATAEPVNEKDMADFLAQARLAARNAALRPSPPPPRSHRWLTVSGAVLAVFLLVCVGLLFVGSARGLSAPTNVGISHRQVARTGLPRVIALADSGDANAQTTLALAYLLGHGVSGDEAAAMRWSIAAAAQGQPVAEYLLGTLYLEGNRDQSQAVRWFKAAADQGNIKAMHNLAIAYAEGMGVARDPTEAVSWFVRAAQEGYRDSEFDLAVLYERGMGVPQSARAALKWYLIAAARGDAPSASRAAFLKTQMDPTEAQAAADEAASFVPQPVGAFANETPEL